MDDGSNGRNSPRSLTGCYFWLRIDFLKLGMGINKMRRAIIMAAVGTASLLSIATSATASNLITNGTFETGTYAGWTTSVQPGSNGSLYIAANGAPSPTSNFPTATNGAGGSFYSITDQG